MWRVVWVCGDVASGKTTLMHDFVAYMGGGSGHVVTITYRSQRYIFSEVGQRGSRIFVLGPASAYLERAVRPGIDSGSTPYRGSFHLGVEGLLEKSPHGTLVMDVSSYPATGLRTLERLAEVYALHMPHVSEEVRRRRYYERRERDPRYYSKTFERNHEMVTKTLDKVRAWLREHASREVQTTASNVRSVLHSMV